MNKTMKPTLSLFEEELAICENFLHRGEAAHPLRWLEYSPKKRRLHLLPVLIVMNVGLSKRKRSVTEIAQFRLGNPTF